MNQLRFPKYSPNTNYLSSPLFKDVLFGLPLLVPPLAPSFVNPCSLFEYLDFFFGLSSVSSLPKLEPHEIPSLFLPGTGTVTLSDQSGLE